MGNKLICSYTTLIAGVFSGTREMEGKGKPLKRSCQNPVEYAQRLMQFNFRTRVRSNLFSGYFDKVGTVLASRYTHSSCARMMRGAKTGYMASLTSVTSPNSWTTYRACLTGF